MVIKIHICPKPLSSNLQVPTIGFGGKEHQITLLTPKTANLQSSTMSQRIQPCNQDLGSFEDTCCAQIEVSHGFTLDTSSTSIVHTNPAFQPSFMLALLFPQQLVGRPASPSGHQAWLCSTGSKRSKPGWLPQRPGHRLPNRTPPSRRR